MTTNPAARGITFAAAVALTATSLLGACGSSANSAADTTAPAVPSIAVSDAWARTSPTVAAAGAVYMTIVNTGGLDDALVRVSVDPSVAASAQLHETVSVAASGSTGMTMQTTAAPMMKMQPLDRLVAPANGSVALKPGGYHIMLMDLAKPLTVGNTVDVTLTFEKSGDKIVTASIREIAP